MENAPLPEASSSLHVWQGKSLGRCGPKTKRCGYVFSSAVLDTTDKLQSCEARKPWAFGSGKAAGWNNMLEGFCALVSCWARGSFFFLHP